MTQHQGAHRLLLTNVSGVWGATFLSRRTVVLSKHSLSALSQAESNKHLEKPAAHEIVGE